MYGGDDERAEMTKIVKTKKRRERVPKNVGYVVKGCPWKSPQARIYNSTISGSRKSDDLVHVERLDEEHGKHGRGRGQGRRQEGESKIITRIIGP